ncbi:MAG: hypothetical protein DWQ36_08960 [Acidobacteria bacterium]|nr:MAG: hypothetical protein DWQ30_22205 [Acidobacteriota bacterium]REK08491.1 MAG: hypothetical protein DWQ36_08960 [Acidobacteriota bacterium]
MPDRDAQHDLLDHTVEDLRALRQVVPLLVLWIAVCRRASWTKALSVSRRRLLEHPVVFVSLDSSQLSKRGECRIRVLACEASLHAQNEMDELITFVQSRLDDFRAREGLLSQSHAGHQQGHREHQQRSRALEVGRRLGAHHRSSPAGTRSLQLVNAISLVSRIQDGRK